MARDDPLGLEPFGSELKAELLEAERLGRVKGRCPFHNLSVGEAAAPDLSGECGVPLSGIQIRRRKDQAESLGTTDKTSWPS